MMRYIEGDLLELYHENVNERNIRQANWRFAWEVLKLFRPSMMRPIRPGAFATHISMFKNYFKVTWRNLLRQKSYALLNIGGLALGILCFLVILIFVRFERSYDTHFTNADQIYRVINHQPDNLYLGKNYYAVTPVQLAPTLMENYASVEAATAFDNRPYLLTVASDKSFWEQGIEADRNFFRVFPHTFLSGDPLEIFSIPQSIVLTESLARKMFGTTDVQGQTVSYRENDYQVSAVVADPPQNSSLQFTFVANLELTNDYRQQMEQAKWNSNSYSTFFTLREGGDLAQLESQMPALVEASYFDPVLYPQNLLFETLDNVHFNQDTNFGIEGSGDPQQLWLYSIIAILVLLLACINYMNLAIARSIRRAKEVGMRKVIGAQRRQLIIQFLTESIFLAAVALVLALAILPVTLPAFGAIVDRQFNYQLLLQGPLLWMLALLVLAIGLISGSYPALFMSRLRPITVLKGSLAGLGNGQILRKVLIVGQYTVSMAMVIASLVIFFQFRFIQNRDLGFETEQVVTSFIVNRDFWDHYPTIREEWLRDPNVQEVAALQNLPSFVDQATIINNDQGGDPSDDMDIYQLRADADFFSMFDIELIAGRVFSKEMETDLGGEAIVINESAAKALGWSPQEAVGQAIPVNQLNYSEHQVIGVIKDFHSHSLHQPMLPLMIQWNKNLYHRFVSVKVTGDDLFDTFKMMEKDIKAYSARPLEFTFLDDQVQSMYEEDQRQNAAIGSFTLLALLIASLGLFGLAAYSAKQRTKEVGIRKVLGASVGSIVKLFSWDFMKLVLLGFALAVPLAGWAMDHWLQAFAYRITLQWWMFALAGLAAAIIAFLTVSSQSVRAAIANPVNSLRSE